MDDKDTSRPWLARPAVLHAALTIPVVLSLISLGLGFVTDDYGFRARLHSTTASATPPYDLFRFAPGPGPWHDRAVYAGALPWWSAPDLAIHFLRPLTSLLFAFDDRAFGDRAVLYHLHSVAWFLLLLFAAWSVFRRLLPREGVPIALLVFGLAHAHVAGYAWPSARHAVVGAALGVLAVSAHLRARAGGTRWTLAAVVLLVLALAASETALGAAALWVAFDLGDAGGTDERRSFWRRIASSVPAALVALVYLVAYRLLGGGARGSGGYHDPFSEPLTFLHVAALRVPALLGDGIASVPVEAAMVWPAGRCVAIGLVATLVLVAASLQVRRGATRSERRAMLAASIAIPPMLVLGATGFPSSRVLGIAEVPFAIVIAVVVRVALRTRSRPRSTDRLSAVAAVFLLVAHVALSPLSSLRDLHAMRERARASEHYADVIATTAGHHKRIVLVAASDPYVFLYPRAVLSERDAEMRRCWSVLSAARSGHTVRRVDDATLAIDAIDRPLLDGSFDTLFRGAARPFAVGDAVRQCGLTIRVTSERGGLPTGLEVTFERSIDLVASSLFIFRDHDLVPFEVPAIGESVTIPWSSGPAHVL